MELGREEKCKNSSGTSGDIVNILYERETNDNNMILFVLEQGMREKENGVSSLIILKVKLSSQNKIIQSLFFQEYKIITFMFRLPQLTQL